MYGALTMKFTLTFKCPDVLDQLEGSEEEIEKMQEFARKYMEYSEYITVEFDPDNNRVVVNPRR